jgi:hypothetical protein
MLLHCGVLAAPSSHIRVVAMGYPLDVLCSITLTDEARCALLGRTVDSNVCRWLVAAVSSSASVGCALLGTSSFNDPWVFDTGATSHMTVKFTDFADFRSVPRRWINGLSAYDVGEGTVHLFMHDTTCSPFASNLVIASTFQILPRPMVIYMSPVQQSPSVGCQRCLADHPHCRCPSNDSPLWHCYPHHFPRTPTHPSLPYCAPHSPEPLSSPAPSSLLAAINPLSPNVQQLWHARLGHLSGRVITTLARSGITDLPPQQCVLPFCTDCAPIKSTVAPRPRGLHPKPNEPFERSGWDFWQNNTTSLHGNSYSCGATDYASSIVAL